MHEPVRIMCKSYRETLLPSSLPWRRFVVVLEGKGRGMTTNRMLELEKGMLLEIGAGELFGFYPYDEAFILELFRSEKYGAWKKASICNKHV